jgi:hypothetical protein
MTVAQRNCLVLWLSLTGATVGCATPAPEVPELNGTTRAADKPLVRKVDHFFAMSTEAEVLMVLFRDKLGLPQQWPFRSYGAFASGAVSLGNVVFEFVQHEEVSGTEYGWLAFEPVSGSDAAVAELDRRGLAHGTPEATMFPDSATGEQFGWINTTVQGLSGPGAPDRVFLCDYVPRRRVREGHDVAAAELIARGGGPLGVLRAAEILFGVSDLAAARREWQKMLESPEQDRGDRFRFGDGPIIRLVEATNPGIQRVVLQVKSAEAARAYLRQIGMEGESRAGEISIDTTATLGLDIVLSERNGRE